MLAINWNIFSFIFIPLAVILSAVGLWFLAFNVCTKVSTILLFRNERSFGRIININHEQHFVRTVKGDSVDLWWLPHPHATDVVLYLHGNSGRLPHFFQSFCKDYNVLAPSYPGYGLSEGSPSEENIYETAKLAYQWLIDKGFQENQIIIWGHSLGGVPAVYLASKHPDRKKLVVVNSFDSVRNVCRLKHGFIAPFFIRDRFRAIDHAKNVEGKVVHFCYSRDKTVPFASCKLLYDNYKTQNKKLLEIDGPCHEYFDVEATLKD